MLTLPPTILAAFLPFTSIFQTSKTASKAFLLAFGAILCQGGRTVCSILRVLGLSGERAFSKYHQVLNRATWDCLKGAKVLLQLLIGEQQEVVIAVDAHLERRGGKKIRAKGCYRDPVKSSRNCVVKSFGLKWLSMTVLRNFSWAKRCFALPFFTVLMPHHLSKMARNRPHKTMIDWAQQMVCQVRRWLPKHRILLVGDGEFATAAFAWTCLKKRVGLISLMRLDSKLFDFLEPRTGPGRPAKKGPRLLTPKQALQVKDIQWQNTDVQWYGGMARSVLFITTTALWHVSGWDPVPIRFVVIKDPQGAFESVTLMSTDVQISAQRIIELFVARWSIEVTFRETREHLGVETQRQWSDKAIARTTPVLFALYSIIVILGNQLFSQGRVVLREAAWYKKSALTFSDLLASVRSVCLEEVNYSGVDSETGTDEIDSHDSIYTLLRRLLLVA